MMRSLIIDTSTERGIVAILENGKPLFHAFLPFGLLSGQSLLPTLQKELNTHGIGLESLTYIAVGVGPGSYTGIRIGATVAKTLAFAGKVPLVGVCTLDAFVPEGDGAFAAVIDAKIGGLYVQTGICEGGIVTGLSGPKVCTLSEASLLLRGVTTIVTPNAEKIRPKLVVASQGDHWRWEEKYPSCEQLERVAKEKISRGVDERLELLYLRKTQAELEK